MIPFSGRLSQINSDKQINSVQRHCFPSAFVAQWKERPPDNREVMGWLSVWGRRRDFFFLFHARIMWIISLFHISLPSLKLSIFLHLLQEIKWRRVRRYGRMNLAENAIKRVLCKLLMSAFLSLHLVSKHIEEMTELLCLIYCSARFSISLRLLVSVR